MIAIVKPLSLLAALAVGASITSAFQSSRECSMSDSGSTPILPSGAELRRFGKPDEVRTFPKGRLELVKINGATLGRAIFEPGWRWSTSVQPLAKTKSCEAPHFQYHVYGVLKVVMDDGTEFECHPGDISYLPAGHDAWVVGDEPAIVVDFHGMLDYAKEKR